MRSSSQDPAAPGRLLWSGIALLLLLWALHLTEFHPGQLFEPAQASVLLRFLSHSFPPAHDAEFLRLALRETWRTVAIATSGMTLAGVVGLPAALLLTRGLSVSALGRPPRAQAPLPRMLRGLLRALLIVLRSVPELIWALLLVRVVGLGPTAGVLAIAITYAGMLGKVYAEIFESADPAAAAALLHAGNGRLVTFAFAILPQCSDELISYTVYRWECAIRSSVVLGFVGAGGLGQQMDLSMKMFAGNEVATLLGMFVLLVALADGLSATLRRVWA